MFRRILLVAAIFVAAVYLLNASWLAPAPSGKAQFIAHRGQHQNFDRTGLTNDSCTATMIRPPIVDEIENTLPAMQAAFAAGASIVELDVHPTTDGKFAVFHDWTLDCRTEGTGETRSHDMAYLKTLDVGYGYTADGGQTFPASSPATRSYCEPSFPNPLVGAVVQPSASSGDHAWTKSRARRRVTV